MTGALKLGTHTGEIRSGHIYSGGRSLAFTGLGQIAEIAETPDLLD